MKNAKVYPIYKGGQKSDPSTGQFQSCPLFLKSLKDMLTNTL